MIFSVVGGKLSEGINFSDELGRCVVMVGLPFPNLYSVELQEKMNFLNANLPKALDGRMPGKIHYDNLCMKAVNQSIGWPIFMYFHLKCFIWKIKILFLGRAIRHKDDYAVILLVDIRYGQTQINQQLPSWIGERLQISPNFPDAFGRIRQVRKSSPLVSNFCVWLTFYICSFSRWEADVQQCFTLSNRPLFSDLLSYFLLSLCWFFQPPSRCHLCVGSLVGPLYIFPCFWYHFAVA